MLVGVRKNKDRKENRMMSTFKIRSKCRKYQQFMEYDGVCTTLHPSSLQQLEASPTSESIELQLDHEPSAVVVVVVGCYVVLLLPQ